jgi:ribonuclease VapC
VNYILDSSALIAMLDREPGGEIVTAVLDVSAISAVNLSEVVGFYSRKGTSADIVEALLKPLPLEIVSVGRAVAFEAGMMQRVANKFGLSLGDRICLALARQRSASAMTADRIWKEAAAEIGIAVELIR